jgi:protein disulfide-isomerase
MNLPKFVNDSSFHPFRFALILAAIAIVALLASSSKADEGDRVVHWTTSYQEAVAHAGEQNTPIMLFFSGSDWCPWCRKLTTEVFENEQFAAWCDSRVITVLVDFPRKSQLPPQLANQNNRLLNRYRPHLDGFPTALFIRPDGTVIGKLGYEPQGLLVWINKAQRIVGKLDKTAMVQFPDFR